MRPDRVSCSLQKFNHHFVFSRAVWGCYDSHRSIVYRIVFSLTERYPKPIDPHSGRWMFCQPFVKLFLANIFAFAGSIHKSRDVSNPQRPLTNICHGRNSFYITYSPQRVLPTLYQLWRFFAVSWNSFWRDISFEVPPRTSGPQVVLERRYMR